MLSFSPAPIPADHWDYRPAVSSPLSSSPIRASSPLSPVEKNTLPYRQSQSSPIQPPKFKYASRPTRKNPMIRRREDTHEIRRLNFLQNVRHKSDDKAWQRRDIEGQFLKASFRAHMEQVSAGAPEISEADIEDAMFFQEQAQSSTRDDEEMVIDDFDGEDRELEAMLASYAEQQQKEEPRPSSELSDDEYDRIFADLLAQEEMEQRNPQPPASHHADAMDEDHHMSF